MAQEILAELVSSEPSDATRIIIAYLSNPNTDLAAGDLKIVILDVVAACRQASAPVAAAPAGPKPAVPIDQSVHDEYLVCLEDGQKLTLLKRYLHAQHGMSPEEYRAKWSLPSDYPMTAPAYSRRRSDVAKKQGLGRKAPPPPPAAAKRKSSHARKGA